ncbi:MAG TPA: transcriptional regulator [Paenibacillaceae bacterium]|nr:transcriptional regulator [Paenibacillaceae bacterium]
MSICPNLEYAFQILGKKWNGYILHFLSTQREMRASFNDIKNGVTNITSKALSACLQDLISYGLVLKNVKPTTPVSISYELTEKGTALVVALRPIQQWAYDFLKEDEKNET